MIGTPAVLKADSEALLNLWHEWQSHLSSALIMAAAAVAVRNSILGYSLRTTLWLLFGLAILVPVTVFLGVYWPEIYRYRESSQWEAGRHSGFFGNPNSCGVAGCSAAAIGFGLLTMTNRKLLVAAGLATIAVGVLLTFSRAAIILFLALTLAQIFISPVFRRKSIVIVGAILLGGILWFVMTAASGDQDLSRGQFRRLAALARIFQGDFSAETTGGRGAFALYAIQHWMKSPIIGHGLGAQREIDGQPGPHNTFIRILGEGGVLPAALFLVFFVVYLRAALRCKIVPVRTIALGYLLLFALACMTSHDELVQRFQNIMLGICFGLLAGAAQFEQAAAVQNRRRMAPVG
jgi:O-antigen ligase